MYQALQGSRHCEKCSQAWFHLSFTFTLHSWFPLQKWGVGPRRGHTQSSNPRQTLAHFWTFWNTLLWKRLQDIIYTALGKWQVISSHQNRKKKQRFLQYNGLPSHLPQKTHLSYLYRMLLCFRIFIESQSGFCPEKCVSSRDLRAASAAWDSWGWIHSCLYPPLPPPCPPFCLPWASFSIYELFFLFSKLPLHKKTSC